MTLLRFAHLADLHLDTPFKGLGAVQSALAQELRDASLTAWDEAVAICLQQRVDFVLIAGDVYDSEQAGVRAQLRFLEGVKELTSAGVEVFIVHGNHDPRGGRWSAVSEWPDGTTVFGNDRVETAVVERDGVPLALVHGMSYPQRHVTDNLALGYSRDERDLFQVGLLHANVGDHPEHGRYAPCSLADLTRSRLDYWALGHVHDRQVLRDSGPMVVYPGNLQARHPNERGAKGFYIGELRLGSNQPELTFHPADSWRFETVTVPLTGSEPGSIDELSDLLSQRAAALADEHGPAGLILSAVVRGAGALHAHLRRGGAVTELLAALRDAAGTRVWWRDLTLLTRPELDRAARIGMGDFLSDLLKRNDAEADNAGEAVAELIAELEGHGRLGSVARELNLVDFSEEAAALWAEADQLALDYFDQLEAEERES